MLDLLLRILPVYDVKEDLFHFADEACDYVTRGTVSIVS